MLYFSGAKRLEFLRTQTKRKGLRIQIVNKKSVLSASKTQFLSFSLFFVHENIEENILAQNSNGISPWKH